MTEKSKGAKMLEVGQEISYNNRQGVVRSLPEPEDSERQGMVEIQLDGLEQKEWVAECFLVIGPERI